MKKFITMILTLAIAISGIVVPADKANAEETNSYPLSICVDRLDISMHDRYGEGFGNLMVGKDTKVPLFVSPRDDKIKPIWSSSNPSVASIDENGILTAKKIGITTISAKRINGEEGQEGCWTEFGSCEVKVVKNEYKSTVKVDHGENYSCAFPEYSFNSDITRAVINKKGDLELTLTGKYKLKKKGKKEWKQIKKDLKKKVNPKQGVWISNLDHNGLGGRGYVFDDYVKIGKPKVRGKYVITCEYKFIIKKNKLHKDVRDNNLYLPKCDFTPYSMKVIGSRGYKG